MINSGDEYTNNHAVVLALGNTDAVEMRIVDGISDTDWIAFNANYNHTLSVGDGLKTVTVRFKDIGGVELSSVNDTIQLDTFLNVAYFNQSGASTKGDLLHLELSLAQELGATVTATISGIVQDLPLLDNGFGGDTVANDGIYERDFYIDTPIDIDLPASATITDLSGNTSTVESATNIVLNTSPTIKNLTNSSNIVAGEMTLNFSTDEPATATILYGDSLANLTNELDVSSNLTKTHTVQLNGLSANSMTYYRITVADSANNNTELEGQGKLAPAAVAGLGAYAGSNEVGLIWNVNANAAGYRIYRSNDGGNVFTLVNVSELITERFYVDALATNDTEFHYRVTAVDIDNNESEDGDSVTVKPEASLAGPTEISGGLIDVNTVWLKSRSPYNISANIKVKKDIELLLLPGTEVAFTQANLSIYLAGTISALGQEDNLVKISAFESGNTNYSGAIIYEQGNNLESQLDYAELNYLQVYYDYENEGDRNYYLVPVKINNSTINSYLKGGWSDYANFYLTSVVDSTINIYGAGSQRDYRSAKINSVVNVVFNKLNAENEDQIVTNYSARITNAKDSSFNGASFYFENGSIDNSQFNNARIERASTLTNSTLTNSTISGEYSLRANSNTLTNTQIILSGDDTKLTMHYSTLDSTSTVSAKVLDVSHNYWGTTDLTTITNKTGYSPEQSKNTHLYPIITTSNLYEADWDNDTIPDYIDYDNDNDGYSDLQEDWQSDPLFGSIYNPLDAESHPETDKDNDMDALADADDLDDDNDGLLDSDELIRLTDKFLADSDGDGVNDGNEVSYKYNPLDKANFPLMGNISGKTIDNSNVNSEGVVYIVGYEQSYSNGETWIETVNLTNVTVVAGTALMLDKDTPVNFTDSVIEGEQANVVTIRSTGAGSGHLNLNNTLATRLNLKISIGFNANEMTEITYSDLSLNQSWDTLSGKISESYIYTARYTSNSGEINNSYITGQMFSNGSRGKINNSYITNEVRNYGEINSSYILNASTRTGVIKSSVLESINYASDASTISGSDVIFAQDQTINIFFDDTYLKLGFAEHFYSGYGSPADQIGDGVAETQFTAEYESAGPATGTWTVDGINNPRSTPNFPDLVFKPYLEANGIWSPKNVGAWWDMNDPDTFPDSDPSANMGTISGQIQLDGFANHSGVNVEIMNTSLSTVTDADGNWSIRLPARDYANGISFTKSHIQTITKDRSYTVTALQDTDIGTLDMGQATASVTGVLAIDEATDYTLATITASKNGQSSVINPSASGEFTFEALTLGDYTFAITYPNGSWETVSHALSLNAGTTEYTLPVTRVRNSFVYINDGALYTNSTAVNLAITNANATNMVITENEVALPSEAFSATKEITLSSGDGEKTVQVGFTDADGNALTQAVSTITLDTQISLTSLTLSTVATLGDTLHIALTANETDGVATVTLPGLFTDLTLFDDGTHGDTTADDGVYEADYFISSAEDITATATASFVDRASNTDTITSATDMVIATSPTISNLLVQSSNSNLVISFNTNELVTATINYGTSADNLDQTLTVSASEQLEHIIELASVEGQTIYFTVTTDDGVTSTTELTSAGILAEIGIAGLNTSAGNGEIGLVWTKQVDASSYRIYRSDDSNTFSQLSDVSVDTPYYVDDSVYNDQAYYYRVTWLNAEGDESDQSNSVSSTASIDNAGATELNGGVIAVNEIWLQSRSPYIITGNMLVKELATLSLMPGTEVEFNGAKRHIMVQGNIMAYGSADALVKISTDPVYNYSGGENGDQSAIIYDTANNKASEFNYTELNYLKVYSDYTEARDRHYNPAPVTISNSNVDAYSGSYADFHIQNFNNSTYNEFGSGLYDTWSLEYYGGVRIYSSTNSTFNKLNLYSEEQSTTSNFIARIDRTTNSTFNGAKFYFSSGSIENSTFNNATAERASTITNTTFTDSEITSSNPLRLTDSNLINTDVNLTGDNTRLTMHYSVLDAYSSVSASLLDISYNYWGSTDLTAIAEQSGYSPDKANDTHLYPIITGNNLYLADWDEDTIPDYLDYDNDNDGYSDLQEDWESDPVYGAIFNPLDVDSHPDVDADNDMDGLIDVDDLDDDNDGLVDTDEVSYSTDPFLVDSDGDGVNDGDEVQYGYDPIDKSSKPLMGDVSNIIVDASYENSDGKVYVLSEFGAGGAGMHSVQWTNITINSGISLLIERDLQFYLNDSSILGSTLEPVIIRTDGSGMGSFNIVNSKLNFVNMKFVQTWNFDIKTVIDRSELGLGWGYNYSNIKNSFINSSTDWYNYGVLEHNYLTGTGYWRNRSGGQIIYSHIYSNSSSYYLLNYGLVLDSVVKNRIELQSSGELKGSISEKLDGYGTSQISNSDIKFYRDGEVSPMFFDNTFIEDPTGTAFYDGYGTPVDQLGDGVAETIFNLSGYNYTVDGINNPRSTKNFTNGADDLWSPEGVGALWDKDATDPTLFPEPTP